MVIWRHMGLGFRGLLLAFTAWALGGCAWIDTKQRELLYRPTPGVLSDWQAVGVHDEPLWLPLETGGPARLRALWIPQESRDAPVVLYLHGTFRNVFQNRSKIAAIHAAGFAVLAADYRGWGESTPLLPSQASILQDAQTMWREFERRAPRPWQRVLFGHSMGSAVAIQLAWEHREERAYGALVVESAFSSLPDIARDRGGLAALLAWLVTQDFDTLARIPQIEAPKWFVAGSADRTVPPAQSQRLFDAARAPKRLVLFEGGGHSSLHTEDPARYRAVWGEVAAALAHPGDATPPTWAGASAGPAPRHFPLF
jgi:uncharacterized protein